MTVRRWRRPSALLILGVLATLVVACSSGATPSPSAGASAGASAAASITPSQSAAASSGTEPSTGAASSVPSIAIPSLPSDDKDLEALLPSKLCGLPALRTSIDGETFLASADPSFGKTLERLDKSTSDLVVAFSGTLGGCSTIAAVFRVKGADPGKLQAVFLDEAANLGASLEQKTLGGKSVYAGPQADDDQNLYGYFVGDAMFFVTADSDAAAADALKDMP